MLIPRICGNTRANTEIRAHVSIDRFSVLFVKFSQSFEEILDIDICHLQVKFHIIIFLEESIIALFTDKILVKLCLDNSQRRPDEEEHDGDRKEYSEVE